MAHTKVTKTGTQNTGTANTFSYSGSFDVFKASEVEVELDNIALTFTTGTINESASPREYTVDYTTKTVHVGGANLVSSNTVVIQPVTDMGAPTPRATYAPGSSVTSADLNNNQLQLMRKALEYDEQKLSSRGGTMTGNLHLDKNVDITFEGDTANEYETTLTVTDPTTDKTITLPDATGTVPLLAVHSDTTITSTPAELNILDGVTSTAAELNILDGVTSTASELNILDGVTATATELNLLDGVTATTTELNLIDGVTATTTEINYIDGVTSNIQTQLDAKQPLDSELTTLAGMQGATASKLAGGTALTADIADLNQIDGLTKQTTISDSDASFPTSGAVVDYVTAQIAPLGGLEVIATEVAFPNTQPQAGVVISISDAGGTVFGDGTGGTTAGQSLTGRTVGGSTVTINNAPSSLNGETLVAGVGLMVSSTGSSQTYNYHKILGKEDDIKQLSDDINDFNARYRVASSAPTSSKDDGDLWFDTTNNKIMVYNASNAAWQELQSTGNFYISTLSPAFDGSTQDFTITNAPTYAAQILLSINGVIQKPNTGTSTPSEGFALSSSTVKLAAAPPTGSTYHAVVIGSTVNIGTPSDNTVTTAILQNGSVTGDKISTNLDLIDNKKIRFGTGNDLQIYHDGTETFFANTTGDLHITNSGDDINIQAIDDIRLKPQDGQQGVTILGAGAVKLYYDNSQKLETTSTGVDVTSRVNITGANEADVLQLSTGNAAGNTFAGMRGDNEAGIRIRGGGSGRGGEIELAGGGRDVDPAVIKFSTTIGTSFTERMRILADGGLTFNGDTATANALDDYEEGTWTPELRFGGSSSGITYTHRSGSYTKVGRVVTVNWAFALSDKGSQAGHAEVHGIPFNAADLLGSTTVENNGVAAYWNNVDPDAYAIMYHTNTSHIEIKYVSSAQDATPDMTNVNCLDNTTMRGSLTYFAT